MFGTKLMLFWDIWWVVHGSLISIHSDQNQDPMFAILNCYSEITNMILK